MDFLRGGDTLVVTRLDRLACGMDDLPSIARELQERSVALKATKQPADTSNAAGKAFFQMLGVFAEFETNLRKERQMDYNRIRPDFFKDDDRSNLTRDNVLPNMPTKMSADEEGNVRTEVVPLRPDYQDPKATSRP